MRASGVMPELAGAGVAHDDDGGGAVVQRAGVAGRHLAVGTEDRLEVGQLLRRGARARAVVAVDDGAVGQRDRGDLAGPEAVLLRGAGALLRAGGERVHVLAGDVFELGDVFGGLPHGDVDVGQAADRRPGVAVAEQPALGPRLGVAEERVVRARRAVGAADPEAADALDAGGDERVALAGLDGVRRDADRGERGRAVPVDRQARHGRQVGEQADDASRGCSPARRPAARSRGSGRRTPSARARAPARTPPAPSRRRGRRAAARSSFPWRRGRSGCAWRRQ